MNRKSLKQLRQMRGISQEQLARKLEVTQGNISKLEQQSDIKIPTLRRYIEGLGGKLEIIAAVPEGEYKVEIRD